MSKLVKIVVSVLALSLFYLWISSFFQSCGNKSADGESQIDLVEEIPEEEIIDVSDEDFFEDTGEFPDETATAESFEELEETMLSEQTPTSTTTNSSSNSTPSYNTSTSSGGDYMLISGNYLVENNAREMVRKLNNLGYTNAEVVIFDRSQYHTVVASRFTAYDAALRSASTLKQKGVDCYVKKRG